jgi:hypothetical protein
MPLVDVLDALNMAPRSLTRYRMAISSPSHDSAGAFVPGAVSSLSFQAHVEPAKGRDLEKLREGLKVCDVIRIYSETPLELLTSTHLPDEIDYQSTRYRIEHVDDYLTVGGFVDALAVKKGL